MRSFLDKKVPMKKFALAALLSVVGAVSAFASGANATATQSFTVTIAPYASVAFTEASFDINAAYNTPGANIASYVTVKCNCPITAIGEITSQPSGVDSTGTPLPSLPTDFVHIVENFQFNGFNGNTGQNNDKVFSQGGTGEAGAGGYITLQYGSPSLDVAAGTYTGGVLTVTVTGSPA